MKAAGCTVAATVSVVAWMSHGGAVQPAHLSLLKILCPASLPSHERCSGVVARATAGSRFISNETFVPRDTLGYAHAESLKHREDIGVCPIQASTLLSQLKLGSGNAICCGTDHSPLPPVCQVCLAAASCPSDTLHTVLVGQAHLLSASWWALMVSGLTPSV